MNSQHLIDIAVKLAKGEGTKPRQAELRRALSTAYYAMFHCVAKAYADTLNGATKSTRNDRAWLQAYRSLSHTQVFSFCKRKDIQKDFSPEMNNFRKIFNRFQIKRNNADYNPKETFYRSQVLIDIDHAEDAITDFKGAKFLERKAFVTFATTTQRKS